MAGVGAIRGQRQRGNSRPRALLAPQVKTVRATANLDQDLNAKLRNAAQAAGLTMSAYVCILVDRDTAAAAPMSDWTPAADAA